MNHSLQRRSELQHHMHWRSYKRHLSNTSIMSIRQRPRRVPILCIFTIIQYKIITFRLRKPDESFAYFSLFWMARKQPWSYKYAISAAQLSSGVIRTWNCQSHLFVLLDLLHLPLHTARSHRLAGSHADAVNDVNNSIEQIISQRMPVSRFSFVCLFDWFCWRHSVHATLRYEWPVFSEA